MARAAVTQLQQQIEEVRREAFGAGYAAAMQTVREVASRPARKDGASTAAPSNRGRGRAQRAALVSQPTRARGPRGKGTPAKTRRLAAHKSQRGTNALIIEEILKAMAPSAVRPAEIRKALQDNGVTIFCLYQSCSRTIASAQRSRASGRQQDLALPWQRNLMHRSCATNQDQLFQQA